MLTGSKLCFTINRLSYHTTGWLLLDPTHSLVTTEYVVPAPWHFVTVISVEIKIITGLEMSSAFPRTLGLNDTVTSFQSHLLNAFHCQNVRKKKKVFVFSAWLLTKWRMSTQNESLMVAVLGEGLLFSPPPPEYSILLEVCHCLFIPFCHTFYSLFRYYVFRSLFSCFIRKPFKFSVYKIRRFYIHRTVHRDIFL